MTCDVTGQIPIRVSAFLLRRRDSNIFIQQPGGLLGIAGLDGDASLRFARGKAATSPFRRTFDDRYGGT